MGKVTEIRAVSLGLREPGIDFDADKAWGVLGSIAEKHSELDQYSTDEKESKFKIAKDDSKGLELSSISLSKDAIIVAVREECTFADWTSYVKSIFEIILQDIKISPLGIEHLDNQYLKTWETSVHHGNMLYELFGQTDSFIKAFPNTQIQFFSPGIQYILDEKEQIVCKMKFTSKAPTRADLFSEYPEDYELIMGSGIAKSGKYKPSSGVMEVLEQIHTFTEKYQDQCLNKYFFEPIDTYLKKAELKETEDDNV